MTEPPHPLFASRTDFGSERDPLTEAVAERRAAGLHVLDLSESNPTRCGLQLPPGVILPPLASAAGLHYRAEPFGPTEARRAIAAGYYEARGCVIEPEAMMLTASTSEAYSFLFRLLCEPGDHVLVPQPSYPLFDLLARVCDVETRTYPLRFQDGWEIDLQALKAAIGERTRAIVVVHPNNPTGQYASEQERAALDALAARHGLPLLVDEVFLDYALEAAAAPSFAAERCCAALTFVMSGLSKVLALPQMKLAWTVVLGPEPLRREALSRLEYLADTFLSVGSPVSHAVPAWLPHSGALQAAVRERLRSNLRWLDEALARESLVRRLPVQAGWSVVLRLPATGTDGAFALRLLEGSGVLVHPGSFFGMRDRGWLVASLLLPEPEFRAGMAAVFRTVSEEEPPGAPHPEEPLK